MSDANEEGMNVTELTKEKRIEQLLAKVLMGMLFLDKLRAWDNPLAAEIHKTMSDAVMASIFAVGNLSGVDPERLADAYDRAVTDVMSITDKLLDGTGSIEDLLRSVGSQTPH